MNENVLVIAAHPDDECLGVGATMWTHAQAGDRVQVLIVAEGSMSRIGGNYAEVERLRSAAHDASKVLGCCASPAFGAFPDNRLDSVDILDIAKFIEEWAGSFQPSIVYTHHPNDCNIDHETTHRACLAAFRSQPGSSVKSLRLFEVLSATEWGTRARTGFIPQHYQTLTEDAVKAKKDALECYASEMRSWPHARSYESAAHLMRLRGCQVGHNAAEAFQVEYQIA